MAFPVAPEYGAGAGLDGDSALIIEVIDADFSQRLFVCILIGADRQSGSLCLVEVLELIILVEVMS